MRNALSLVFGGNAQVVVGVVFLALTSFEAWLWGFHKKPDATAIFWLSIEALIFASYSLIAVGLGFRATERVETAVTETLAGGG